MKEKLVDTIFASALDDPALFLHQIILHSNTILIEKYQCYFQYSISLPHNFLQQNRKMPLLILFHGTPGGWDQSLLLLNQCFSETIRQTFPILLFSRQNYLGSQFTNRTTECSWELQADILEEFLMKYMLFQETELQHCFSLINHDKVIIFGISGGVAPALCYARKYNRKCIGFISLSAYFPIGWDWTMQLWPTIHSILFKPTLYHFLFSFALKWTLKICNYFPSIFSWCSVVASIKGRIKDRMKHAEHYYYKPNFQMRLFQFCISNGILQQRRLGHWNDIQQFYNKYKQMEEWIRMNASQVNCPALVFHDKLDTNAEYRNSQLLYQQLQNSEFYSTETSGHLMMLTELEIIRKKLDQFLLETIQSLLF